MRSGIVFVVSAPSGAGKRTVLSGVFANDPRLVFSVSSTTRSPRVDEQEGVDYYFTDRAKFEALVETDAFVEWAEVHGNLYGTLQEELERRIASGCDVVLELDVQGMRSVKWKIPTAVTVFVAPPSLDELEYRLRNRGTNSDADVRLRLENARAEMAARHEYDYIVINDDLEVATADLAAVIRAERCRASRQP